MHTYFKLDENEILIYRLFIVMMAFFLPVYGLFLLNYSEHAIDFMWHRGVISMCWAVLLILTFFRKSVREYLALPCYIGNAFTVGWIVWVVHVNQFSPDYSMGLFLTLAGIGIIYRSNWEMFSFYLFSAVLILISYYFQPHTEVNIAIFLLSIFIVFLVYLLVMGRRDYINKNLRQLNLQLQFKSERQKQFLYAASHDLKTPLRGIGSFSFLLKENVEGNSDAKNYLDRIMGSALRMDRILDDVLDFFKYDKEEFVVENFEVRIILEQTKLNILWAKEGQNIQINIPNNLPQQITGERTQLEQLFFRIIENGIKYNHSEIKIIDIKYTALSDYHLFSIRDNGIGISKNHQEKIFGLFKRLHHAKEFSGTGVGLAICKIIIENHNGAIWVESSEEGKGTEFRFQIPRKLKGK